MHETLPSHWPSAGAMGEAIGHIFQTREFVEAWQQSFGQDRRYRPLFVEVSDASGAPLLFVPLVVERRRGVSILTFLDQGQADYNAPILYPAAADQGDRLSAALWTHITEALPALDVLRLEKMPPEVGGLKNPFATLSTGPHGQACHGNDLRRPLPEIESVLLSPKELRQKQRGLEKLGPVRFLVAQDATTRRRLLDRLVAQKQRRFEETHVPGYAEHPEALAFLRAADETFAKSGNAFICALMVGEEVTAAQWGLVLGKHFYALVTGFEGGAWARFSCGRILNLHLLHYLVAQGFTYFDQGYGDEAYKLRSSDTTVPLLDARMALTARGRVHTWTEGRMDALRDLPQWELLRQLKWRIRRRLFPSGIEAKDMA
ncbi:MAG: GNAT family N-acetyltransferase [Devosia sp.]